MDSGALLGILTLAVAVQQTTATDQLHRARWGRHTEPKAEPHLFRYHVYRTDGTLQSALLTPQQQEQPGPPLLVVARGERDHQQHQGGQSSDEDGRGMQPQMDSVIATVGTIISSEVANAQMHDHRPQADQMALLAALDDVVEPKTETALVTKVSTGGHIKHEIPVHFFPPSRGGEQNDGVHHQGHLPPKRGSLFALLQGVRYAEPHTHTQYAATTMQSDGKVPSIPESFTDMNLMDLGEEMPEAITVTSPISSEEFTEIEQQDPEYHQHNPTSPVENTEYIVHDSTDEQDDAIRSVNEIINHDVAIATADREPTDVQQPKTDADTGVDEEDAELIDNHVEVKTEQPLFFTLSNLFSAGEQSTESHSNLEDSESTQNVESDSEEDFSIDEETPDTIDETTEELQYDQRYFATESSSSLPQNKEQYVSTVNSEIYSEYPSMQGATIDDTVQQTELYEQSEGSNLDLSSVHTTETNQEVITNGIYNAPEERTPDDDHTYKTDKQDVTEVLPLQEEQAYDSTEQQQMGERKGEGKPKMEDQLYPTGSGIEVPYELLESPDEFPAPMEYIYTDGENNEDSTATEIFSNDSEQPEVLIEKPEYYSDEDVTAIVEDNLSSDESMDMVTDKNIQDASYEDAAEIDDEYYLGQITERIATDATSDIESPLDDAHNWEMERLVDAPANIDPETIADIKAKAQEIDEAVMEFIADSSENIAVLNVEQTDQEAEPQADELEETSDTENPTMDKTQAITLPSGESNIEQSDNAENAHNIEALHPEIKQLQSDIETKFQQDKDENSYQQTGGIRNQEVHLHQIEGDELVGRDTSSLLGQSILAIEDQLQRDYYENEKQQISDKVEVKSGLSADNSENEHLDNHIVDTHNEEHRGEQHHGGNGDHEHHGDENHHSEHHGDHHSEHHGDHHSEHHGEHGHQDHEEHGSDHGHHEVHHPHDSHHSPDEEDKIPFASAPTGNLGLETGLLATDIPTQTFVQNNNRIALGIHQRLAPDYKRQNMVVSPIAVTSSLGMLFLGARGRTADEIDSILRLDTMNTFNPHVGFFKFMRYINKLQPPGTSAICNVLFKQQTKADMFDGYAGILDRFYKPTIVSEANLKEPGTQLAEEVNSCINKVSNGVIGNILNASEPFPKVNPSLVTASGTYFNLSLSPRVEVSTIEMPFLRFPSALRRVLLTAGLSVTGVLDIGYSQSERATVVALPIAGNQLQLVLILPGSSGSFSANGLSQLEAGLTPASWSRLLRSTVPHPANVRLPIISQRTLDELSEPLFRLGVKTAGQPGESDFSGMNGIRDLTLGGFLQMAEMHLGPVEALHHHAHSAHHGDHGDHHGEHHGDHGHHGDHHGDGHHEHHGNHDPGHKDHHGGHGDDHHDHHDSDHRRRRTVTSNPEPEKSRSASRKARTGWRVGEETLPWERIPESRPDEQPEALTRTDVAEIIFERAFMYAIRHKSTGAILLTGRYLDPHSFL